MSAAEEALKQKYAALKAKKAAAAAAAAASNSSSSAPANNVPSQKILGGAKIDLANLPQQPAPNRASNQPVKRKRKGVPEGTNNPPNNSTSSYTLNSNPATALAQQPANSPRKSPQPAPTSTANTIFAPKTAPETSNTINTANKQPSAASTLKIPKKFGGPESSSAASSDSVIHISLPTGKPVDNTPQSYQYVEENGIQKVNKVSFAIADHLMKKDKDHSSNKRSSNAVAPVQTSPTTVYVGGLTLNCSMDDLIRVFSAYGSILNCKYELGRSFAFVEFAAKDSAQLAIHQMNNSYVAGSVIHTSAAKMSNSSNKRVHTGPYSYVELEYAEQEQDQAASYADQPYDILLAQFQPELITEKLGVEIETYQQSANEAAAESHQQQNHKNVLKCLDPHTFAALSVYSRINNTSAEGNSANNFSNIPPRDYVTYEFMV
jgi:RNA recognition motif-containing protein